MPLFDVVASTLALTILHPLEGAKLPAQPHVFAYGAAVPGSTLTINGLPVPLHTTGGYLTMVPLSSGDVVLNVEAVAPSGEILKTERRFSVAAAPVTLAETPLVLDRASVTPASDLSLMPGDTLSVSATGSPNATAEFSIETLARHVPMSEVVSSSGMRRGIYQGHYIVQPGDALDRGTIDIALKQKFNTVHAKAPGRLTIEKTTTYRVGQISEDTVAARTAPDGGYDFFLFKGMRVVLTGKQNGHWRTRLSSTQSGWVRENAIQELPRGTPPPSALFTNMVVTHLGDSSLVRLFLSDMVPYRIEQRLEPTQLTITLFGAAAKTDLIRFDPTDPLIKHIRWRQTAPDVVQVTIDTTFKRWWGYDVRYEGNALLVEIRTPWTGRDIRGLVVAVDAGHGGADSGATGPRGFLEKEANLQMARVLVDTLVKAGAKAFLTRDRDTDVPLYERPRIAWKGGAHVFVSMHSNSSGLGENPLVTNGSSVYFYHPQSQALAKAIHAGYRKHVGALPDRGLFYADFAVCRMTQMPAVLTENAYIIVPDQEEKLFDPKFQKNFANAIVSGIKTYLQEP